MNRATQSTLNWAELTTSLVLAAVSVLLGCLIGYGSAYLNYANKEKPNVPERVVTQPAPEPTENPHLSNVLNGHVASLPPLPHVCVGRRKLIRRDSLDEWLGTVEAQSSRNGSLGPAAP